MSATLLVAPREIADIVYRSSRVTGADSGMASMIGRAACFSCAQLGAQLRNVIGALSHGVTPPFGFGAIVALEAAVSHGGPDVRRLEAPMTVADLAQPAFAAASRGTIVDMICGDGDVHSPRSWLSAGRAELEVIEPRAQRGEIDQRLTSRVIERHQSALAQGIAVPQEAWDQLTILASETP
jgi:hypothetical protein